MSIMNRVVGMMYMALLYLPFLYSYMDGCVDSSKGTTLSQNLYSIAYNYVTQQGESAKSIVHNE